MTTGPIIIIEDDQDDKEIVEEVLQELGIQNEVVWFARPFDAYAYLRDTKEQPLIIFSDINLPGINGIDFKKQIDQDPIMRRKSIPFVFMTTAADKRVVDEAYKNMTIQGFLKKPSSYAETKEVIRRAIAYWQLCKHPSSH